jgi:hypothetical protein
MNQINQELSQRDECLTDRLTATLAAGSLDESAKRHIEFVLKECAENPSREARLSMLDKRLRRHGQDAVEILQARITDVPGAVPDGQQGTAGDKQLETIADPLTQMQRQLNVLSELFRTKNEADEVEVQDPLFWEGLQHMCNEMSDLAYDVVSQVERLAGGNVQA